MLELVLVAIAGGCVFLLARPLRRRYALPEWLVRARLRRRPGIPVTAWLAALSLMGLVWLVGERRGVTAFLALSIWVIAPLVAGWITWYWVRGLRTADKGSGRKGESAGECPTRNAE